MGPASRWRIIRPHPTPILSLLHSESSAPDTSKQSAPHCSAAASSRRPILDSPNLKSSSTKAPRLHFGVEKNQLELAFVAVGAMGSVHGSPSQESCATSTSM